MRRQRRAGSATRSAAAVASQPLGEAALEALRKPRRDRPWAKGESWVADYRGLGYPHTITEVFEGDEDAVAGGLCRRLVPLLPSHEDEHRIGTLENQPLAVQRNRVVVGDEETNPLMRHLGGCGTFTYDKVCGKITAEYPGRGRGLIGVVKSVNAPSFDPADQTRDAVLAGGSDEAGTISALERMIEIVGGQEFAGGGRAIPVR